MSKTVDKETAEEILKLETGELRSLGTNERRLVALIAISWALFQLCLAGFLIMNSTFVRAIHLAFGMTLLFLLNPLFVRERLGLGFLSIKDRIPLIDYILATVGASSALYIAVFYNDIAMRAGDPNTTDIVVGVILVLLLLEAARRIIGPALTVIAMGFTLYAFLGPHMPDLLAFKGVSLRKYLSQISLSTEGIYGIPLGVSASIVYLFVLLGSMLDKAGAGRFFTDLALSLLGRFKGGAAKAAVVSSGLTGMVSGSSIANIVTTGPFTIPLMKKIGYPAKKAAAIEVASSTDGQLMPPIMGAAAFIIAEYVNVPYMEVVKAAAIPAFVSYFGLFCITHLEACKLGIKGLPREDVPSFSGTLKKGIHYLIPLGTLLYELIILRHSPELSAFRAIIVLMGVIAYQEIRKTLMAEANAETSTGAGVMEGVFKGIKKTVSLIGAGFIAGSKNMIPVALATAAAGIIVGIVNMGIGGMITQIVEVISGGNIYLLLAITAIASLLLGMGLPTTATYIVMASLTAPIIVEVAGMYDLFIPLMAAHLFVFYFGILADDTPPVGLAAYAAAAIAESEPIPTGIQSFLYDIRTSIIAFMFVFNPELILHNINSWPHGLMIFGMALVGIAAFENAVQGWFLTRNKLWELPFFLAAAFILFYPGAIASLFGIEGGAKYFFYFAGLAAYALAFAMQKYRMRTA
ncbi:MAG: TRAP transporter permease [Nitrospinota bacterium]